MGAGTYLNIGLSVGAVGAVVAGGVAVSSFLSGGGTQPEDVLPASTMAFAKVDLNPSAGQKLNVLRLVRKFPEVETKGEDLKATAVEALLDEADLGLKYKSDIAPWLGDRAAVAVVPSPNNEEGVAPLVVLEFTDQEAMVAALDKAEKKLVADHEEMYASMGGDSGTEYSGSATQVGPDTTTSGTTTPGAAAGTAPGTAPGTQEPGTPGTLKSAPSASASSGEAPGTAPDDAPVPETFSDSAAQGKPADPDDEVEDYDPFDYAVRDNFVLLSEHQSDVDKAVAAGQTLARTETFAADKATIDGDDQIVLAWMNVGAVYDVIPEDEKADFAEQFGSARPAGRVVVGVHAESDAVEAVGRTIDLEAGGAEAVAAGGAGTGLVTDLPVDTSVAFSVTGLGDVAADLWDEYATDAYLDIADEAKDMGLKMPEDLFALLGQEAAAGLVLDERDSRDFAVTARVRTEERERALEIIDLLEEMEDEELHFGPVDDGYVISTHRDDMADAGNGDRTLGEDPVFANAVPGADDASVLLFVNVDDVIAAIEAAFGSDSEPEPIPLEAFGATATGEAGNGSFTIRLTFK